MQQPHNSGTINYRTQQSVPCGQEFNGEIQLCRTCLADATRRYPQGWRYYPGDVCKHGRYTGGSGRDLMCGACELGDLEPEQQPRAPRGPKFNSAGGRTW